MPSLSCSPLMLNLPLIEPIEPVMVAAALRIRKMEIAYGAD